MAGAVYWNKRTIAAAEAGVSFSLAYEPAAVMEAVQALYVTGAKAGARRLVAGVQVTAGSRSLTYETKSGDVGRLLVTNGASGTLVTANAERLFVGAPSRMVPNKGIFAISWVIGNSLYRVLGIAPTAAKIKRLQGGLQSKIEKQLTKAGAIRVPAQRQEAVNPAGEHVG